MSQARAQPRTPAWWGTRPPRLHRRCLLYQLPPGPPLPPSPSGPPDDGRPTRKPVPGHPLLRTGSILVWPLHFKCAKCAAGNNTGYKHADPVHPCHRFWECYMHPYASVLVHAHSASASVPTPAHASLSFQRPLPRTYVPLRSPVPHRSTPPPCGNTCVLPGCQYAPPLPTNGTTYPGNAYPPPHAIYLPGDVCLGSAPCWRCAAAVIGRPCDQA
ncbi:hypothetical protein B0H17DRAFT_935518 [Mycena rosella]|uniref:Uncharacterized protein n=1 Tax=Mycena rosella TaxID=1033263 RepID=A0AAD7DGK0_MYCRO|nr:hypothetical protein B0H17DRAFT_935518 [Mycena rosella]